LVSGGSGFIQFIQILSKIWYRESTLVLLDEPDAHLNPNLVYDMIKTLSEYAREVEIQIVIATHSKDVLDVVEPEQILVVDYNQNESKSCVEGKEAAYEAIGVDIPVKELALLQMFNRILLIEGSSDRNLLNRIGAVYNSDFVSYLRNTFILPIKGKSNFDAYRNFFNSLQRDMVSLTLSLSKSDVCQNETKYPCFVKLCFIP